MPCQSRRRNLWKWMSSFQRMKSAPLNLCLTTAKTSNRHPMQSKQKWCHTKTRDTSTRFSIDLSGRSQNTTHSRIRSTMLSLEPISSAQTRQAAWNILGSSTERKCTGSICLPAPGRRLRFPWRVSTTQCALQGCRTRALSLSSESSSKASSTSSNNE